MANGPAKLLSVEVRMAQLIIFRKLLNLLFQHAQLWTVVACLIQGMVMCLSGPLPSTLELLTAVTMGSFLLDKPLVFARAMESGVERHLSVKVSDL